MDYWREQGHDVTAVWYNPNIHPFTEHQRRLEALVTLTDKEGLPLIVMPGYEMDRYFRAVAGHEAGRCEQCYQLRLEMVAEYAGNQGYDGFTSSLLISPQQKHEQIVDVARRIEQSSGVKFEYADLRKRYSDSRCLTKPLALYRQQYCGCLYSEYERYHEEIVEPAIKPPAV
jgi:hypothetical protein